MNKQIIAVLISISLLQQTFAQSQVQDAGNLLDSLVKDAEENLKNLEQGWADKSAVLGKTLEQLEQNVNDQREECDFWEGNLKLLENSLENMEKNMDFLSAKIKKNEEEIARRKAKQCENQRIHINSLKNNKITLKFIEFLRAAIKKAQDDGDFSNLSFAQRKMVISSLFNFLQILRTKDYRKIQLIQKNMQKNLAFLEIEEYHHKEKQDTLSILSQITLKANTQQDSAAVAEDGEDYVDDSAFEVDIDTSVQARTSEEIGSGHIDNDRENIEVDTFESGERGTAGLYLQQILDLLDQIEKDTKEGMEEAQAAQIEAGLAFVDYLVNAEKLRGQLDGHLLEQNDIYSKTGKAVRPTQNKLSFCHDELVEDKRAHERVADQISAEENTFNKKKAEILEELEILIHVNNLYNDKVEDNGEDFEDRIDDHVEDGEFDQSEGQHDIDNIDYIDESNEQQYLDQGAELDGEQIIEESEQAQQESAQQQESAVQESAVQQEEDIAQEENVALVKTHNKNTKKSKKHHNKKN